MPYEDYPVLTLIGYGENSQIHFSWVYLTSNDKEEPCEGTDVGGEDDLSSSI